MTKMYADIVVPLAVDTLTFGVGVDLEARVVPGVRVLVQLGRRKYYAGVVWKVHGNKPPYKTVKDIESVIDDRPVVTAGQMKLWDWVSSYYMSPLGMVMRAAMPAMLKVDGYSGEQALSGDYRPRQVACYSLHPSVTGEEALTDIFEGLKRARAQRAALAEYIGHASPIDFSAPAQVPRSNLSATSATLRSLVEKGVLVAGHITDNGSGCTGGYSDTAPQMPRFTPAQSLALDEINGFFANKEVVLLHGVTGSGKTEIYISLIDSCLREGRSVLYMLPEIALTTQLVERLKAYFGDYLVVYHSRLTNNRRAEIYRRLLDGGPVVVLGVRSSVFLPLEGLGLVIVDEEHETSFKQSDGAPRYHGRDCAVVLAHIYGARTLLGSATPSMESWANAKGGKYGLVTLAERYGGVTMPRVVVSDTIRASKRGERAHHMNKLLFDSMTEALARGKQVILFQNRRGFSPYIECGDCGWTAGCPHCNVTLTYHKSDGTLRCHYCGYRQDVSTVCPDCGSAALRPMGFGTEKIEEELSAVFPEARIARLDADSTRGSGAYRRIIGAFERGETDILVGTQMLTKGFDFGNVSLVGVLNADNMLCNPDFRASERAFQLMMQVAGRAGRRGEQGLVVVQTSQVTHPVILRVMDGDYGVFASTVLSERASFMYPPYSRLMSVELRHRDQALLWRASLAFENLARPVFGRRLLGPQPPPVDKIRGEYIVSFLLKIEKERSAARAKDLLRRIMKEMTEGEFSPVAIFVDVDPQ